MTILHTDISDGAWGAIGALGAVILTALFTLIKWLYPRLQPGSEVTRNARRTVKLHALIDKLNSEFKDANIVSISAITNHDQPVNFQILNSSDTQTNTIFSYPEPMESALTRIVDKCFTFHYAVLFPETIEIQKSKDWFNANKVKYCELYYIGGGKMWLDKKKQEVELILMINWTIDQKKSADAGLRIAEYVHLFRRFGKELMVGSSFRTIRKHALTISNKNKLLSL